MNPADAINVKLIQDSLDRLELAEDGARIANEQVDELRDDYADLRHAVLRALDELGVPGEGYPAPVANAVAILVDALEGDDHLEARPIDRTDYSFLDVWVYFGGDLEEAKAVLKRAAAFEVDGDGECTECNPPYVDVKRLYAAADAVVWAEEFAKVFPEVDEGTMVTWFANAMCTALDRSDLPKWKEAARQADEYAGLENHPDRSQYQGLMYWRPGWGLFDVAHPPEQYEEDLRVYRQEIQWRASRQAIADATGVLTTDVIEGAFRLAEEGSGE